MTESLARPAKKFTDFIHAIVTRVYSFRYVNQKLKDKNLALSCGMSTPDTLKIFQDVSEICLSDLPDRFVLKPKNMASKRGVMLLTRKEKGFVDLFQKDQGTMNEEEIKALLTAAIKKTRKNINSTPFIAETLIDGDPLAGPIPLDYKIYTIDSSPVMILQIDRNQNPNGLAFFDSCFAPISWSEIDLRNDIQRSRHIVPKHWEKLLHAAQVISTETGEPFISVDMFATDDDVFLGELTLAPGGPYFGMFRLSDKMDSNLGALWEDCLSRRGIPVPMIEGNAPVHLKRY